MLSDAKIKNLKPRERIYKITDRDGMYVSVLPSGTISFRYNYRINGRQETVVLGQYGEHGLSLKEAREKLDQARKALALGVSPARQKTRERGKAVAAESFGQWAELWLKSHKMADSTRDMRRSVLERDLLVPFGKLKMWEITHQDLRALCDAIVGRGAPATAVHAREIVMMVFRYANERGHRYENPADMVRPHTIATFVPKDRALSVDEIRVAYKYLEYVATFPTIKLAVKLLLLTMLRKSELIQAQWNEINFTSALMIIPGERMKRRNPHIVYLSRQALDMFVALRTCAGGSRYVFPSRYDPDAHMSNATLNRVLTVLCEAARNDDQIIADFSPHDLRRTASTHLHEGGYNTDWIEKCLAHEQKGVRAVYNKAEYAEQRRAMLQDWADMIDRWTTGRGEGGMMNAPACWDWIQASISPRSHATRRGEIANRRGNSPRFSISRIVRSDKGIFLSSCLRLMSTRPGTRAINFLSVVSFIVAISFCYGESADSQSQLLSCKRIL